MFETFPGSFFCQSVKQSPQLYQTGVLSASISFLETGRSHRVPNQGSTMGGDDSHFVFRQKLLGEDGSVKRGVVMVKQPV
jgi:hypothetical protein